MSLEKQNSLIQGELDRIVAAGVPGAFAYIEDADRMSRFYASGWSDLKGKQQMKVDSHYRVGSTTKSSTSVILLQMVNEGKLRLQNKVSDLPPDLKIPNSPILSVEHLLRMGSGLFDFEDDLNEYCIIFVNGIPNAPSAIFGFGAYL